MLQRWGVTSSVLAITGLGVFIWGIWASRAAMAQSKWHKATATILSSDVRFDGELYQPEIEYEFEYQGIRRTGSKVRSNLVSSNFKRGALCVCERYPAGQEVPVYINPADPDRSVLEPGGDQRYLLLTTCIAAFFVVMAFLFGAG